MHRFVAGTRKPIAKGFARNLSPSYRFTYQVDSPRSRKNVDSAEYANITLHFLHFYELALRSGMEPLPEGDLDLLRAWTARVQYGYWTHAGLLSWDSGLGFGRWMKAKTWAYALQGPLTIAAAPRFHLRAGQGPWAKYVFDRGLGYFAALCDSRALRELPPGPSQLRRLRPPGQGQPARLRRPHGGQRDARGHRRARLDARRAAAAHVRLRRRRRAA